MLIPLAAKVVPAVDQNPEDSEPIVSGTEPDAPLAAAVSPVVEKQLASPPKELPNGVGLRAAQTIMTMKLDQEVPVSSAQQLVFSPFLALAAIPMRLNIVVLSFYRIANSKLYYSRGSCTILMQGFVRMTKTTFQG